jgi:hypothetical protein
MCQYNLSENKYMGNKINEISTEILNDNGVQIPTNMHSWWI